MRKNLLSELVDKPELTAVNSEQPPRLSRAAPLGSKGAVGAMSKALSQIAADRAADVRGVGDIVEIDTALLVASALRDRLEGPDADHADLVASIRDAGQQVPILVRPHPREPGRYEIAYGHRRVAALRALKRPVRALIRPLTDNELIIAQGTENSARKDLTFAERAYFAFGLERAGVDRATIMAALSVDKTEVSRLIGVMGAIPFDLVEDIGPAPKIGRRRWQDLAEAIAREGGIERMRDVSESDEWKRIVDSDARFLALFSAVAPASKKTSSKPEVWKDGTGRELALVERAKDRFTLSIDETIEPAFGDYLLDRLPEILASFKRRDGA